MKKKRLQRGGVSKKKKKKKRKWCTETIFKWTDFFELKDVTNTKLLQGKREEKNGILGDA